MPVVGFLGRQVALIVSFSTPAAYPAGDTVKTEPVPASLITVTSPPIMRASLRVMARPSPVPPKRCAVEASAWVTIVSSLVSIGAIGIHGPRRRSPGPAWAPKSPDRAGQGFKVKQT